MNDETPQPTQTAADAHAALTNFDNETKAYLKDRATKRPSNPKDPESVREAAQAWDGETNDAMVHRLHDRLELVRALHRAREAESAA